MATYKVVGKGEDKKYFDDSALSDVISYVLRDSKTPHANYGSRAVNIENAAFEMNTLAELYSKDNGVRLRHSVISFDSGDHISLVQAAWIAEQAIRYFGDQYQILYGVHEDAAHIHAHIVMNQVSYIDGHKYQGTRKQHYDFINYMKGIVRPYKIPFTPVSDSIDAS